MIPKLYDIYQIVTDPFLNAGSISSGTSLGGRLAAVEGSRTVALDSSDSEEERPSRTRRGSLSAANSTPALTSALGSAPSLSSPANPSGLSSKSFDGANPCLSEHIIK